MCVQAARAGSRGEVLRTGLAEVRRGKVRERRKPGVRRIMLFVWDGMIKVRHADIDSNPNMVN